MKHHALDHPEVLAALFHPRPDFDPLPSSHQISDHFIEVEKDCQIHARCHILSPGGSHLLFFHGNGEIVSDYDQLAPLFGNIDINLIVVDYRGYGRSNGTPSISTMIADCHIVLAYFHKWLQKNSQPAPLIVMGRSLGSASALELAANHTGLINALIIESGFAFAGPLLKLLGVDLEKIEFNEDSYFFNLEKISRYNGPTLIIHAEYDHIIPYSDGLTLFNASPAQDKRLLKINNANHNDIFARGINDYLSAVQRLSENIRSDP